MSVLLFAPRAEAIEQSNERMLKKSYSIGGQSVAVPDGALHLNGEGFFLSAQKETLEASLRAAGLTERAAPVGPQNDRTFDFSSRQEGQRVVALRLFATAHSVGGQPLYWVAQEFAAASVGTARACTHAADEPWTLFLQGLAHVTLVRAQHSKGEAAADALHVDLRHAASQLQPTHELGTPANSCSSTPEPDGVPLSSQQVADSVVWHSAAHGKRLALTFDACSTFSYGPFNPAVIAALVAEDVPATLFVGGHWAEMHPEVLRDLASNPLFEIGNHTYSHPHMRDLTGEQQAQELRWTQALIFNQTGVAPRMFRPPYGEVDDNLLAAVARAGLTTVEYDLPAGDADVHVSPLKLTQWVVGKAQAGSIVIMHMNRPKNHTAEALPMIVRQLRARGFTFCQMSDLLHDGGSRCR